MIIAPLVAIHGLYLNNNGYLTPMKYLEHEFHSKDDFTDDLFVSDYKLSFNVRSRMNFAGGVPTVRQGHHGYADFVFKPGVVDTLAGID